MKGDDVRQKALTNALRDIIRDGVQDVLIAEFMHGDRSNALAIAKARFGIEDAILERLDKYGVRTRIRDACKPRRRQACA